MKNLIKSMQEMRIEEKKERSIKVACDILRALLVLGGAGWKEELLESLAAIAALEKDPGSLASQSEVKNSLKILLDRDLVDCRRGKRSDPSGTSIMEDELCSLKDYTTTLQVFGTDKPVLILRGAQ